jgi:hypothetical protein
MMKNLFHITGLNSGIVIIEVVEMMLVLYSYSIVLERGLIYPNNGSAFCAGIFRVRY